MKHPFLHALIMMLAFQTMAFSQFVGGNPPRQRVSISMGQQQIDTYLYSELSTRLSYQNFSFFISKGVGSRRLFEFVHLKYDARSAHWGAAAMMELTSYRAGNIHWELLLGYENLRLTDIVSEYTNAVAEIDFIKLGISPVWDVQRRNSNDFTRLGMTVTAMTPRTRARYSAYDGEFEKEVTLRNHDIGAFTCNINTSLPWLGFSSFSVDAQAGGMWTNDQLEPLFRMGINLGLRQK